jgi:hypothetical protein
MLGYRLLTDGVIAVAWALAGMGLGWTVARGFDAPASLRLVTAGALGLGAVSLVLLGLGLVGVLNGAVAWGIVLVGLGLGAWFVVASRRRKRIGDPDGEVGWWRAPAGWSALVLVAMPFLGLALVGAIAPPGMLWQDEPAGYDVAEYHLQVPREWYEAGRIVPLTHNVFSYMPMNVEVHDLLAMHLRGGPWAGMYLAQFMHVLWMVLAVWAAWAVAAALSDRPWAGPVAGTAMAVVPWVTSLAPIAYNEAGLMLFGTLAVGWVMLARNTKAWALAGALAGFACGVKLTAVAMVVAAAVVAWMLIYVKSEKANIRSGLTGLATFVGVGLIAFAPWLIRNQIWAGNPVFPERMEWLGRGHFSEVQEARWRKAHSPREDQAGLGGRVKAAWRGIAIDWRYGFAFFPIAIAAAALVRDRRAAFVASLLGIQLIVWLAFTHLQGRFFVLAIPLGAVVVGLVPRRVCAILMTCGIVIVAIVGVTHLYPRYDVVKQLGGRGALGVADLKWLVPYELEHAPTDRPLTVVGDAQVFWYSQIPMSRLRYRTVFDVGPGDWINAWGVPDDGSTVILFPGELGRFARSYFDVPVPPADALRGRAGPFVLEK